RSRRMRGIRVTPAGLSPQAIAGRVLAHDVFGEEGEVVVPKGKVLSELDVEPLRALSWTELHLIELQPGDLHEDTAADRIAEASMGPRVIVGTPFTGARPLLARHRGLLRVDVEALRSVNRIDGVSLSTLLDGQVVEEGETVAVIKIVPLVIPAVEVRDATVAVGADGIVRVAPFRATRIGLVVCEDGTPAQRQRLERAAAAKIEWFGAPFLAPAYVVSAIERIEDALGRVRRADPDVVLVVGAKPMDPLDPVFGALEAIGARMERHGIPAHPGSVLWI